jgi:hypothetical protein
VTREIVKDIFFEMWGLVMPEKVAEALVAKDMKMIFDPVLLWVNSCLAMKACIYLTIPWFDFSRAQRAASRMYASNETFEESPRIRRRSEFSEIQGDRFDAARIRRSLPL